jgi:hypothetical protein
VVDEGGFKPVEMDVCTLALEPDHILPSLFDAYRRLFWSIFLRLILHVPKLFLVERVSVLLSPLQADVRAGLDGVGRIDISSFDRLLFRCNSRHLEIHIG